MLIVMVDLSILIVFFLLNSFVFSIYIALKIIFKVHSNEQHICIEFYRILKTLVPYL